MPSITRDGLNIYYEEQGSGPPLLLLMGLGLSARYWLDLPAKLAAHFRVLTLDNRGVGRSSLPARPFSIADLADDAAAVLDAAGVSKAHVFGVSMGGMIAQELALRHAGRVHALALAATTPGGALAYLDMLTVGFALARSMFLPRAEAGRQLLPYLTPSQDISFLAPWAEIGRQEGKRDPRGPLLQLAACSFFSTKSRLPGLQTPALVMAGDYDRIIPCDHSRRLARLLPRAEFHLFPDTGHIFVLERQAEVQQRLQRFFARHPLS
jgi:pimeloyl-ACP methyl ester carboxylesterase